MIDLLYINCRSEWRGMFGCKLGLLVVRKRDLLFTCLHDYEKGNERK